MILLIILDIIYAVVGWLSSLIVPALPQQIDSILIYIFQLIDNGIDILFTLFIDASTISPIINWVITVQLALLALDLIWRIVDTIKLRREPS